MCFHPSMVVAVALQGAIQWVDLHKLPFLGQFLWPSAGVAVTSAVLGSSAPVLFGVLFLAQSLLTYRLFQHLNSVESPQTFTSATFVFRSVYLPTLSMIVGAIVGRMLLHESSWYLSTPVYVLQLIGLLRGVVLRACYPASVIQVAEPQANREQEYEAARRRIVSEEKSIQRNQIKEPTSGFLLDSAVVKLAYESRRWLLYIGGNAEFMERTVIDARILGDRLKANVIVFNPRGVGRSEGCVIDLQDLVEDAKAVAEHYMKHENIQPSFLLLMGHSIGGGVVAQLAQHHFPESPIVLDRTFSCLADAAVSFSPLTPEATVWLIPHCVGNVLNSYAVWNSIKTHKKMIIYSKADEIINYSRASIARFGCFQAPNGVDANKVYELRSKPPVSTHNQPLVAFSEHTTIFARMTELFPS